MFATKTAPNKAPPAMKRVRLEGNRVGCGGKACGSSFIVA
jgi:hypothetical protein